MSMKPYVLGICGGTCSGKSTLCVNLKELLGEKYAVSVIHMDGYYRKDEITTIAPITRIEYPEHNHPDALEIEKIYEDLMSAIAKEETQVVIIEGIFTFYVDKIREQLDVKVFVDLPSDERIYRRIKRWQHRQTHDEIAVRYLDTVRYRHNEFVEPTRWHADMVINGTLDANKGTDILIAYIDAQIKNRQGDEPHG